MSHQGICGSEESHIPDSERRHQQTVTDKRSEQTRDFNKLGKIAERTTHLGECGKDDG
jgi:hypothetical protein